MSTCGYALSCQTLNAAASQDPIIDKAYPMLKAPGLVLGRGGRWNGLIGGEILHACDYRNEGK
jgi:hypothetical protein